MQDTDFLNTYFVGTNDPAMSTNNNRKKATRRKKRKVKQ